MTNIERVNVSIAPSSGESPASEVPRGDKPMHSGAEQIAKLMDNRELEKHY